MSITALLVSAGLTLVATLLLVVVVRVLARVARGSTRKLRSLAAAAAPRRPRRGLVLLRPEQLVRAAVAIVVALTWLAAIAAGYLYLTFVLSRFVWTSAWASALGNFLVSTLASLGLGIVRAIPELFVVVLIFLVARFANRLLRSVFEAAEQRRIVLPGVHPDTARPTRRIASVLVWVFAFAIAYPHLPGSQSTSFKGISALAGLLFALGSAGLVGQAMSGLVLMYSRSFRVGDFVEVGGVQGTVVELGLLSTRLRTPKNEYVTVPNSVVVAGAVTDFSTGGEHGQALFLHTTVTIGYDTPWRRVHELLLAAAAGMEGAMKDPAPFVLQRALDDSYVEYQVNVAIDAARAAELPGLYSALHAGIQDAFAAAGVEILSPSYRALRDGNATTIPGSRRPAGRVPAAAGLPGGAVA
jgi:small-conductance mechanosensitive channel